MGREEEYKDLASYNWDHPNALDFDLAFEKLSELLLGLDVEVPIFDFKLRKRTTATQTIKSAPIIVFEGIFAI